MTQDNEQYRAGFEAAARRITHAEDFERDEDGYSDYVLDTYWRFWIASKREASTEPSAENRTTAKNAVVAQKDAARLIPLAALYEFIDKVCNGKPELIASAENAFYWFNKVLAGHAIEKDAEPRMPSGAPAYEYTGGTIVYSLVDLMSYGKAFATAAIAHTKEGK